MDAGFWHRKWNADEIGFHQSRVNRMLAAHFDDLGVPKRGRVFVPLCGKTLDIAWLLAQGYRIAGAELSELAIRDLFQELDIRPEITDVGNLKRYHATGIDIFVGDIFDLTREMLGPVDAVYDRAAFVALPEAMRARYARHVIDLAGNAPQFLLTFEYDRTLMNGPHLSRSSMTRCIVSMATAIGSRRSKGRMSKAD